MDRTLVDEGAFALAGLALENARRAFVNVDVESGVKRAAGPWSRDLLRKVGAPSEVVGPYVSIKVP